jgi:hypothetical protein
MGLESNQGQLGLDLGSFPEMPVARSRRAHIERDKGIENAAAGAGLSWIEKAYEAFVAHAKRHEQFLTEDVRMTAEANGLRKPADRRAWGAVAQRAARAGVVKQLGYVSATTGHKHPVSLWSST